MEEVSQQVKNEGGLDKASEKPGLMSGAFLIILLTGATIIFTRMVLEWALSLDSPYTYTIPNAAGIFILLFVLILWNPLIGRIYKGLSLNKVQIYALYVAISASSALMFRWGQFAVSWFWPSIKAIQSPNAAWIPFWNDISSFVVPHSEDVLRPMLVGGSAVPWNAWIGPILTWTIFMAAVFSILICVAELFRKRWNEEENLQYPLSIPIRQVVTGTNKKFFLKDRCVLIGIIISIVWVGYLQMQAAFAWWPRFNPQRSLAKTLEQAMYTYDPIMQFFYYWAMSFGPRGLGTAGIVPMEFLSSAIIGGGLHMLLVRIHGSISNWPTAIPYWQQMWLGDVGAPFLTFAALTVSILMIWKNRSYIIGVFRDAFTPSKKGKDVNSKSSKIIVWVLIVSLIIVVFFLKALLNAGIFLALFFAALFILEPIAYNRFRAESGWWITEGLSFTGSWAQRFIIPIVGLEGLGPRNACADWLTYWMQIGTSTTSQTGGFVLEGYKMCEGTREGNRIIPFATVISLVVTVAASIIMALVIIYRNGYGLYNGPRWANYGVHVWQVVDGTNAEKNSDFWFSTQGGNIKYIVAAISGAAIFFLLSLKVSQSSILRISPIGLLFGFKIGGEVIIAWLLRTLAVKRWGRGADETLQKIFVGMIIGSGFMEVVGFIFRKLVL